MCKNKPNSVNISSTQTCKQILIRCITYKAFFEEALILDVVVLMVSVEI